jgi:hypothetical protein
MQKDRRWFPRFAVRQGINAIISFNDGSSVSGPPIDISQTGAYIGNVHPHYQNAIIKFRLHDQSLNKPLNVERECSIFLTRYGESGGCALNFHAPLTGGELALLAEALQISGSLELAREDYRIVNNAITEIQLCRTHLFMGTMAAICVWVITAVGIGITNNLESPVWIAIGVSLPHVLLTISILSMIEKANAINLRKGFLAALTDFLKNNASPPNYLGWAHLTINRAECRSRFDNNLCPTFKKACWEEEKAKSSDLTRGHHLISNIFDSFTAFVSFIYGSLYILSIVLMCIAGISYWMRFKNEWPYLILLVTISVGVLIPIIVIFLFHELRHIRRGKKSSESYYCEWRAIFRYCGPIKALAASTLKETEALHVAEE